MKIAMIYSTIQNSQVPLKDFSLLQHIIRQLNLHMQLLCEINIDKLQLEEMLIYLRKPFEFIGNKC